MWTCRGGRVIFRKQGVDLVLILARTLYVAIQRLLLIVATGVRRGEAQQFGQFVLVRSVFDDALFEYLAEFSPELAVVVGRA